MVFNKHKATVQQRPIPTGRSPASENGASVPCLTTLDAKRLKGGVARERHFLDFFFAYFLLYQDKRK